MRASTPAGRDTGERGLRLALRYAAEHGVPRRSFRVALVVGTMLNLINQGDAMLAGGAVDWLKCALAYLVPYAVSTYGAVSFRMSAARAGAGG